MGDQAQLAEGPGRIAGHGVLLYAGADVTRFALAQGLLEQRHRLRVLAAHAPQPPGAVVLLRGIIGLAQALNRFGLTDRFSGDGSPGLQGDLGCSHGGRASADGLMIAGSGLVRMPRVCH